jgi:hypothetical protein
VTADDIKLARFWAAVYRERGYQPLPMDPVRGPDAPKKPLIAYAHLWEKRAPADLFERFATPSIQLMTGRYWKLLVIDLDGAEGRDWFYGLRRPVPPTWATHSGGHGLHLWFRLPPRVAFELPKMFLWKGEGKHASCERLCDHSLIVVPPSIHPRTGERYQFIEDRSQGFVSPYKLDQPADVPAWILSLRSTDYKCSEKARSLALFRYNCSQRKCVNARYRTVDVIEAIHDKIGLARQWGLRVPTGRVNASGWVECHRALGEDIHPSASISDRSGRYWEPEMGRNSIDLIDLGIRLGHYGDREEALGDLGDRFHARPMEK